MKIETNNEIETSTFAFTKQFEHLMMYQYKNVFNLPSPQNI